MRKRLAILTALLPLTLAIFVALLVVAQKPLPVKGNDQQNQPQDKCSETNHNAQAVAATEVEEENAANAQRYAYYKAHHKEYLKAAIAPANLSNWVLTGLGVIGGIVAVLTLWVIKRQTNLQAAAMQQWVDVETRGVEVAKRPGKPFALELQFEAVNNTPYLLTIKKIVTTIAFYPGEWERFPVCESVRLPPGKDGKVSGYPFYIETTVETKEGFERRTLFSISGDVTFKDCLGTKQTQWFGGLYECEPGNFRYLKPIGTVADKQEKKRDQKAD